MVKKILRTTDPKLREKSKPVQKADKKLLDLIRDLEETLKAQNDPEGLGLAAPQIAVFQRVFILKATPKAKPQVFINPKIIKLSKKTNDKKGKPTPLMEGCLSLPHYYGPVRRHNSITLKYFQIDPTPYNLQPTTKSFTGFLSHIIQHEVDHLEGIFFVDRLLEQDRKLYQLKNKEWTEITLI